jgi:hypothetical protein
MGGRVEALQRAAVEAINRALTQLADRRRPIANGLSGVHIPDEAGDLFMTVQILCPNPVEVIPDVSGHTIDALTGTIASEAQPHLTGLRAGGRYSLTADIKLSVNGPQLGSSVIDPDTDGPAALVVGQAVINFDLTKLPSR